MFSLLTHCSVCHNEGTKQEAMFKVTKKDEQILNKLIACSFDIDWLDTNTTISICNACYIRLQIANDFIEMCHQNCVVLKGYVVQLSHTSDTRKDNQNVSESGSDSEVMLVKGKTTKQRIIEKNKETENVELGEKLQNENNELSKNNLPCITMNDENSEEDNESDSEIPLETKIDIDETDIALKGDPESETESFANINNEKTNKFEHNMSTKLLTKNSNAETEDEIPESEENMHSIEMVLLEEEPTENLPFLQEEEQFKVEDHFMSNIDVNLVIEQQSEIDSEDDSDDTAMGRNRFKCSICKKKLANKSRFQIHMRTHTGEKPFVCKFCDKSYSRIENLKQHILTIHNIKPYKCTRCGDSFMFRKNLIEHRINHGSKRKVTHTGGQTDALTCSECNEEFATGLNFKEHMLLYHVNKDTRTCELCDKKFSRDLFLERHLMLHTGEVPHTCSLCPEKFLLRYQLREHMAKHKGREFNCLLCGKIFNVKSNLNRHMKLHSRSKSYECEICNKCFSSAAYLRNHQSVHNGESPYECSVCHKKFALRQTMNQHKSCCVKTD